MSFAENLRKRAKKIRIRAKRESNPWRKDFFYDRAELFEAIAEAWEEEMKDRVKRGEALREEILLMLHEQGAIQFGEFELKHHKKQEEH